MHKQIIDYMRANNVHVLCLQETKSKTTTQYVVDNYTFMIISTVENQKQEHAGVGFVLCPPAELLSYEPSLCTVDRLALHCG